MAKQTIQIADKPTEDEILALLKSSEIGLAVLKGLLGQSASADTVAAIKALLENGTYGLNAIKSAVDGRANETTVAAVKTLLENATYGLNAIKSAINGRANETTAAAIKTYLENSTYGLSALKAAINRQSYPNISTFNFSAKMEGGYTSMAEMLKISGKGMVKIWATINVFFRIILDGCVITDVGAESSTTCQNVTVNGTSYRFVRGDYIKEIYHGEFYFEKSIQVYGAYNGNSGFAGQVTTGGYYQLA